MNEHYLSAQTFEEFLSVELTQALQHFDDADAAIYIYCHVNQAGEPSRRVLVVTEAQNAQIAVCTEIAYELFEGDIHHCVRQVGVVKRVEASQKLQKLVREAYEIVMSWKPSFETIEEHMFLPG